MTDVLVLMPTFDHQDTLRYSIPSVLAQTVKTFELVVVGDGAPPETAAIVEEFASIDPRVRYDPHPKSPRTGEPYRDPLIRESSADIVAYCSDDDLWLPWHLEEMIDLLANADFANTLGGHIDPDGRMRWWTLDLSRAEDRRHILEAFNTIGLHAAAHTRASYLALPDGWATTPPGMFTDHHMWRKYLSQEWVRAASGFRASAVHLPASLRKDWSPDRKLAELVSWAALVSDPHWCRTVWPELVTAAQMEAWSEVESSLRSIREYLTLVLEARDQARAELATERENGTAALRAEQERAGASLAAIESRLAAAHHDAEAASARARIVEANLEWIERSLTWRTRERLLKVPLLGRLLRSWRSRSRSSP